MCQGGPKFLYLNPDGVDTNDIGEGETFAQSPQFIDLSYFKEDVVKNQTNVGVYLTGNISSFRNLDNNTFHVKSAIDTDRNRVELEVKVDIANLTSLDYTWEDLKIIKLTNPFEWRNILNSIVFSMNFSLVINVSDYTSVEYSYLNIFNPIKDKFNRLSPDAINLTQQDEFLQVYTAIEPDEKLFFIQMMNTSAGGNNSLRFMFEYIAFNGLDFQNISVNLFNIEVGEIKLITTIQKYDPIVKELHYASNVTVPNGTIITPNDEIIDSLKENDNEFLEVIGNSTSNTTSIEFKFNILQNLDSSLWDVDDPLDWIFHLPNPKIYQIDFRISSNVSITDTTNLTHAMLEIYNGGNFTPFIGLEWLQFSDNKTFADIGENTKILPFDSYYTWYVMHLLNESEDNSLRLRLRFIGNGSFEGINISIDEFTLNFQQHQISLLAK